MFISVELLPCFIKALFLNTNNKKLKSKKSIQNRKLSNLVLESSNLISEMSHNSEKVIFNFSSHKLSRATKMMKNRCFVKV